MPAEISPAFDCRATAVVLRTGNSLALAGHAAAVMSALSIGKGRPAAWIECCSMLIWCAVVYLAVRVRMDAQFFEILAEEQGAHRLDTWLRDTGLRKNAGVKTMEERRRGALRLWRTMAAAVVAQIALMLTGMMAAVSGLLP